MAALAADGTSFLDGYEHISRGYEDIRSDLAGAGARIQPDRLKQRMRQEDRRKEQMEYGSGRKKTVDPGCGGTSADCSYGGQYARSS